MLQSAMISVFDSKADITAFINSSEVDLISTNEKINGIIVTAETPTLRGIITLAADTESSLDIRVAANSQFIDLKDSFAINLIISRYALKKLQEQGQTDCRHNLLPGSKVEILVPESGSLDERNMNSWQYVIDGDKERYLQSLFRPKNL